MAGGKERMLFRRLLKESVLALCRQTMDADLPFLVDAIVCISLEGDDSGCVGAPIVVTIHEQLPKACHDSSTAPSPPLLALPENGGLLPTDHPHRHDSEGEDADAHVRSHAPTDRKNLLLRRALQGGEACTRNGVTETRPLSGQNDVDSAVTSYRRRNSEQLSCQLSRMSEDGDDIYDGRRSDPMPEFRMLGEEMGGRVVTRHSLSHSSEGSDRALSWRTSLSSPTSSELSSPTQDDYSVIARAGSASPQETPRLSFPSPARAGMILSLSARRAMALKRECFTCARCGMRTRDASSLARHNMREHRLFTCDLCLATFTTSNNLSRHARLHSGLKPFKCSLCKMAFSRRDDLKAHKQRHVIGSRMKDARRRHDLRCKACSFVGSSYAELRKHQLSHSSRNTYCCPPCAVSFPDPVAYTAHVKCHSQDPTFRHFRCCMCSAVLSSYQLFMMHQQMHILQHSSTYECSRCGKLFRSAAHLSEHLATHLPEDDEAPLSPSEPVRNVRDDVRCMEERADERRRVGEDEDDRKMQTEEGGRAWCTECYIGFPDEDMLIQHITDSHESRDQRQRPGSAVEVGDPVSGEMDTSDNGFERKESTQTSKRKEKDSEKMETAVDTEARDTPAERIGSDIREEDNSTKGETGDERSSGNEGTLKGFPTPNEDLGRADSGSSQGVCPASTRAPPTKSSPLRVIPLSLPQEDADKCNTNCRSGSKTGSVITLVKPKDWVINTDPYPAVTSPSPYNGGVASITDLAMLYMDRMGRPLRKDEDGKYVDNFLTDKSPPRYSSAQQAGRRSCLSDPGTNFKQEPLSDPESSTLSEPSRSKYRLYRPGDFVTSAYRCLDPSDLPTDLSMNGSSSASPRSVSSGSGKSPSFEKVITPDVLFRARSPLLCPIKDCGLEFIDFGVLEDHSAKDHRRYLCEYCGKDFSAKPNRDRHVRYHTGVKPYKCPLCSQAFYRGDDLKYHRTTKHPKDTEF